MHNIKESQQATRYKEGILVQVAESDIAAKRRILQKSLCIAFNSAKKYIYITSPYLLPPRTLQIAIYNAKKRGVDVKVLTDITQNTTPLITAAMSHFIPQFLRKKITVYQYFGKELHAKTVIIDGIFASSGSFNFDGLSYGRNLECNINTYDAQTASILEQQFERDLEFSRKMEIEEWNKRPWYLKIYHFIVYVGAKLILR